MAWGAAATGTRAATGSTGQGLSLMQESLAEISLRPAARSSCSTWPAPRATTSRPPGAAATATTATSCSRPVDVPEAVELVQLAFHLADRWRNPVHRSSATTTWPTSRRRSTRPAIDFGPLPRQGLGARRLHRRHRRAKLVSPLGRRKRRDDVGYDLAECYTSSASTAQDERCAAGRARWSRPATSTTPSSWWSPSARPAEFVRYVVGELRGRGPAASASSARSRCGRSRPRPSPAAAERARAVAVYELNAGQMIDDVRLAVLGAAPGRTSSAGSASTSSGFGIAPDLDVEVLAGASAPTLDARPRGRRRMTDDPRHPVRIEPPAPRARAPPRRRLHARAHPAPASTTCARAAASPPPCARCVEAHRRAGPDQPHHRRVRHRLLHGVLGKLDVEVLQALHGRAPSLATGVKRARPDTIVFTVQGDGDMVNEGLQEVIHTAARGERVTVHHAQQRRVRRDRRPHDRHHGARPAHEEHPRRPRRARTTATRSDLPT